MCVCGGGGGEPIFRRQGQVSGKTEGVGVCWGGESEGGIVNLFLEDKAGEWNDRGVSVCVCVSGGGGGVLKLF